MRLTRCPSCGSESFAPHCTTAAVCDLVSCLRCNSYGTVDGKRWATRPKVR